MSAYAQDAAAEPFARSREMFASVVSELESAGTGRCTHGELEDLLTTRSRDLMRTMMQDHLDLRVVREQRQEEVTGADGVARTRVEQGHQRELAGVFGPVTVTRMAYRAPGAANLYPADGVLNLPEEKHSHGLRRLAAIESSRGSFQQATAAVERATGVRVGKRQLEQLAQAAAVDVDSFYARTRPGSRPATDLLVLTADAKGIVMLPEALRETTRKTAAGSRHKLATRLSPGEKTGRKRMAELGCVYDATPVPRTPADIITRPGSRRDRKARHGPVAEGKWLTASVTDDIPAVIGQVFDEAARRDPGQQRTWVVLVDGNRTQIEAITAEAARRRFTVHIVVDFVHVLEYLWKAAWSFFYSGDPEAERWVAEQAVKVLDGKAGDVVAGIRRRATRCGYSAAERKSADEAADYLTSKKPYLRYDRALQAGWPIATGIIEGACRHIVKDRLDVTGARWGLSGAEAVLTLRALLANGDFEPYWKFHLEQEHQRVHLSRYQQDYTLTA
jgi:hypothetical protein